MPRGTLSLLDARTGALLHRQALGGFAAAVAVDQGSDRIVVVSQNSREGTPGRARGQPYVLDGRGGRIARR